MVFRHQAFDVLRREMPQHILQDQDAGAANGAVESALRIRA
jgi:hypothetical protein